jgi:hypothetical protein
MLASAASIQKLKQKLHPQQKKTQKAHITIKHITQPIHNTFAHSFHSNQQNTMG